jgi:hypothetical protein
MAKPIGNPMDIRLTPGVLHIVSFPQVRVKALGLAGLLGTAWEKPRYTSIA